MSSPFRYRVVVEWSAEDQAYVARVPALAGVNAHGDTAAEAVAEAQVAAELALEVMREEGRAIPEPDASADYSGKLLARLPKSMHADIARLSALEETSINQTVVELLGEAMVRKRDRSLSYGRDDLPRAEKVLRRAELPGGVEVKVKRLVKKRRPTNPGEHAKAAGRSGRGARG